MFYLTVVLPTVIVTVIYFIMLFTHARMNGLNLRKVYLYDGALLSAIIFLQISIFFAVENFATNELLSGCFFTLSLHIVFGITISLFIGGKSMEKVAVESEKARLLIKDLIKNKDANLTVKQDNEKAENGSILQYREGEKSTIGGFDFSGASELTSSAKKKSKTTLERENTLNAERVLDKAKKGESNNKREIESAVDSLIKIVSSK